MEVIYKDSRKLNLPKNVKQIGTKEGKRIVYIEDYAYSFIKDISVDEDDDGAVGILLGEVKKADGVTYIFIKGVVEVLNAAVYTDHIAFTQETWPITKKYIAQYFGDYDILGWYLSSDKITEENMDIINKADSESFEDEDNVFFMVNGSTGDEAFWQKTEDGLCAMSGYTVYYEKNPAMQRYIKENQSEFEVKYAAKAVEEPKEEQKEDDGKGEYRKLVNNKPSNGSSIKRNLTAIYVLSMLVIIVVLIIGVNKINDFGKNNGNGGTTLEANGDSSTQPSKTPVTSLDANIPTTEATTTEEATTEEPTTEEPTTEEPTTEEPTTEAPTEAEKTYTVQAGDGLYRICQNVYGKYDAVAANNILTYNGITANDLQPGIVLKIPSLN